MLLDNGFQVTTVLQRPGINIVAPEISDEISYAIREEPEINSGFCGKDFILKSILFEVSWCCFYYTMIGNFKIIIS